MPKAKLIPCYSPAPQSLCRRVGKASEGHCREFQCLVDGRASQTADPGLTATREIALDVLVECPAFPLIPVPDNRSQFIGNVVLEIGQSILAKQLSTSRAQLAKMGVFRGHMSEKIRQPEIPHVRSIEKVCAMHVAAKVEVVKARIGRAFWAHVVGIANVVGYKRRLGAEAAPSRSPQTLPACPFAGIPHSPHHQVQATASLRTS